MGAEYRTQVLRLVLQAPPGLSELCTLPVLVFVPHWLGFCCFTVSFEIRNCEPSNFDSSFCLDNPEFVGIPYEF